jgi:hypothetical protein
MAESTRQVSGHLSSTRSCLMSVPTPSHADVAGSPILLGLSHCPICPIDNRDEETNAQRVLICSMRALTCSTQPRMHGTIGQWDNCDLSDTYKNLATGQLGTDGPHHTCHGTTAPSDPDTNLPSQVTCPPADHGPCSQQLSTRRTRTAHRRANRCCFEGAMVNDMKPPKMAPFQFNTVIQPDRDLIGGNYDEFGRQQFCLDPRTLMTIAKLGGGMTHELWKMGKWVHCRRQPRDSHRVVSTRFGWRVLRSPPEYHGFMHTLGHALADIPLLFPSAQSAIAAAEILIRGRPPELWYFNWLKPCWTYLSPKQTSGPPHP